MTAGGARRGRRDNGLDAADYAVAGDVDPRVGEHLLDVLAAGGIAAYLQPSSDLNPILRTTTLPARPTDRLYVDRVHLAEAREQLDKLTGGALPTPPPVRPEAGGTQSDVDAEWAKIIAGFHTTAEPTWPEAEGAGPDPAKKKDDTTLPSAVDFSGIQLNRRRTDPKPPDQAAFDALDELPGDEEDERYIPPPPPPLPRLSKYAIAGIISVIVGFVLFIRPSLLPIASNYVTLIGFTAVVGGAVTLVWRLRSGDDDDDDFDDGAVV